MEALKNKYRSLPTVVKASLWYTLCSILIKGTSFLTVPIFSRVLSVEDYGKYTLYNSWVQLFTVLMTLNLSMGVFLKGLVKYEDQRDKYVASMQILTAIICMVWLVLFLLGKSFFESITGLPFSFLFVMIFHILMISAINFWSTRLRFEYKYISFVVVSLLIGIGTPIINFFAVTLSHDKGSTMIYSFAAYQALIGTFFFIWNITRSKLNGISSYWMFALRFNIPLIPYYFSQIALDQIDRVMIAHFFGQRQVAMYNIPYQMSMALSIISTSISNAFIPTLYQKIKAGTENELKKAQSYILIIIGVGTLFINLLSPEILAFLAPSKYSGAVWIIGPVVIGMYLKYLINILNNIEFYYENTSLSMIISVIAAGSNILLNYFLLPKYGYIIAGYTTMISFLISLILHLFFVRNLKYDDSLDMRNVIIISTMVIVLVLASQLLYSEILIRGLIILLIGVLSIWKRKTILSIIRKK